MKAGDRVFIRPLGVWGEVKAYYSKYRISVLADCAGQNVIWEEDDLTTVMSMPEVKP